MLALMLKVDGASWCAVFLGRDNHACAPSCRGALWNWLDYTNSYIAIDVTFYLLFPMMGDRYWCVYSIWARIVLELRSACSQQVNKLLFEFIGATILNDNTLEEEALLKCIHSVAVRGVHKEVHRMHFSKLTQSSGETITHFVARLNAKASLCDFNVHCTCTAKVPFAEEMVSQQLVAGIRNQDHQAKVLGEAATLTNLSQKVDRLISLETADDATSTMHGIPDRVAAAAAKSSGYKQQNKWKPRQTGKVQPVKPCRGCGKTSHPAGKAMTRRDCPAFGKTCDSCGIVGHYRSVCEKATKSSTSKTNDSDHDELDTDEDEPLRSSTSFSFMTRNPVDGSGFQCDTRNPHGD